MNRILQDLPIPREEEEFVWSWDRRAWITLGFARLPTCKLLENRNHSRPLLEIDNQALLFSSEGSTLELKKQWLGGGNVMGSEHLKPWVIVGLLFSYFFKEKLNESLKYINFWLEGNDKTSPCSLSGFSYYKWGLWHSRRQIMTQLSFQYQAPNQDLCQNISPRILVCTWTLILTGFIPI